VDLHSEEEEATDHDLSEEEVLHLHSDVALHLEDNHLQEGVDLIHVQDLVQDQDHLVENEIIHLQDHEVQLQRKEDHTAEADQIVSQKVNQDLSQNKL